VPAGPTLLGFTLLSLVLAVAGYDWIHLAQRYLAYLLIGALLIFTVAAAAKTSLSLVPRPGDFQAVPFLAQFFAAAAYQISWSIYVSDYSRYLPRDVGVSASFWWTYFGAFVGGSWTMLVGTVAAALYPTLEVAAAMRAATDSFLPGFGTPLLLCSLLGLVTITSVNFYGASLTLLSVLDSLRPSRPTLTKRMFALIVAAIAASALAAASTENFVAKFGAFLSVLLYLFTPWTAINLVDFYWVRKGHYSVREIFNPHGMYGRWNWRGLLAYGVGFVAMIPFFSTDIYMGPVARRLGGADLAMLVGLPVAALVYVLACRSLDVDADRRRAEQADAGLDAPVRAASRSA
jgi:purine-cytosine permease-like protein